ncbi:ABC transporter substrate-binding protein [Jatrophihabitans sp.]|uniref:ABC transporter substrate-binding protein n=1 Tax=Jatrophihabitans sp. TaxID=1932789 RepID=UPI0030C77421
MTVGSIGTFSGPLASSDAGFEDTLKAWVAYTNANGGLNGHPVKLLIKDDAGNPTTGLAAARDLIQNEHVIAIVSDTSSVDTAWETVPAQAGVPVVGGSAIDLPFLTNSDFYASGTNTFAAVWGVEALGKQSGPKQSVLYCVEAPACAASIPVYKAFAKPLGMSIPYTQSISAAAADYTAVCQAIKQSGAQSYVMVDAAAIVGRVADACLQQGVTAKVVEASSAVEPSLLTSKGTDGLLSAAVDFPFIDNSNAATKEFHTVLAKYGPSGLEKNFGPGLNVPWVAMQLFGAAVKAGGSGPVTSDSIKAGLYTMKGETLGGLAPPLTFVKGQANLQNCYFVLGISKGAFTSPDGLKTSCAPDALVEASVKAIKS